jgi:hypothetical protein
MHSKQTVELSNLLIGNVNQRGTVVFRGVANVVAARRALEHLVRSRGLVVSFDPRSAPDLRDYLFMSAYRATDFAIVGSVLGFTAGLLVGAPRAVSSLGRVIGAAVGAVAGFEKVRAGWRLRAAWDADGQPVVAISSLRNWSIP